jgi:hypothetical protein
MTNEVAWILLSFAIMLVAVLARLSEELDHLEWRLERLEPPATIDHARAWLDR